ncbi:MAG: recombinase family protein [Planctomycetes bacterium]|nr:recombinase family protein [Planctomycetota bacterium]MCB9610535.1 recombinase family protein [Polyangiaceae bacterium]MCB9825859.1 recombinase family protein [Planctomycetota bacterium]MCB9829144.1 recombinase family protein [Planctomycetota bacterium]MCB9901258.1 recombinase family protein [Planctomycetota bacterium]
MTYGSKEHGPGHRPVGVWVRVSTANQAAGDSPETHEQRALGYAAAKGWEVVEVYRLAGVSGKNVRDHSECRRMLEDIKSGKIEALIFSKLARLARNTRDLLDFADYFREHEADLVSLKESIDTGSHAGRFFYTMLAALAQFEREEIASRVKDAVATRAKLGKPLGGAAPYGYRYENGQLVVDPEEGPVRALMYELFVKDPRIQSVARTLNERGLRTRAGKRWGDTSVRSMLADPISKGLRRTNHSYRDKATGRSLPKPESEWVYIEVEPVVSDEVWDQVNAVLDARAEEQKKRPGRTSKHLFTGYVVCECGGKMYVPSRVNSYRCKVCGTSAPADDLEAIFIAKVKQWLTPETIAAILLQADQMVQDRAALKASLSAQVAAAQADLDRLFDLHAQGQLPTLGFRERYEPLDARRQQLKKELATVEGELNCFQMELQSEEQALAEAELILDRLQDSSLGIKRQALEILVREIVIGKEEVVLRLNYSPFPSLETPTRHHTLRGAGGVRN